MTYQEALARIRSHSALSEQQGYPSLLLDTARADRDGVMPSLTPYVQEIVACLAIANHELNGARPSETFARQNPQVIADLSCPVSCILVGLLQDHRRWSKAGRFPASVLEDLRDAALRIGLAWDMLLAGDIDDLQRELEIHWHAIE